MTRKVIQIVKNDNTIIALCDDGTIWEEYGERTIDNKKSKKTFKWMRINNVPQDDINNS
jgi:hypothetical protein